MNLVFQKLQRVSKSLQRIVAQQNLELLEKVKAAGFETVEEAIPYAVQYRERTEAYTRMCGPLIQKSALYEKIKAQLPTGEVSFHFSDKKNLGRMRALVRLVCIRHQHTPHFRKQGGEEYFDILPQKPLDLDTWGTLYGVKVTPITKPKALAFYKLDPQTRRQLIALAH